MSVIDIQNNINNNCTEMTIDYADKLLERASIFIDLNNPTTDIEKFTLLKILSVDIAFSCELLLKVIIHKYNNGHDLTSWTSHNLKDAFDLLTEEDKNKIYNELKMTEIEVNNILQDNNTTDAFIKRYLYETNTGIPNYNFLCDLGNALLKINGKDTSYSLKRIDTLSSNFDTTQFSFEEIIQKHTSMLYKKSQIYSIEDTYDEIEEYMIENMKSCDYALFSELRYKYFDRNQHPKKQHDYDVLHKRLDDACKFLVSKSRFMDRYMSKDSKINFVWALESLMFDENFNTGDPVSELYRDVNETFEKSRFCTTEYYNNYYNAKDFFETIKSITDLLIMNGDKANKIFKHKEELIKNFSNDLLISHGFTVDEMEIIDIEYIKRLNEKVSVYYCPKSIILENNERIRDKIFYFINNSNNKIPICIDTIVKEENNEYCIDYDRYNIDIILQSKYDKVTDEKIDLYIKLSQYIRETDVIIAIMNSKIDINEAILRYQKIHDICNEISTNEKITYNFINDYGPTFIFENDLDKISRYFILYNYLYSKGFDKYSISTEIIEELYDIPLYKLDEILYLYMKYGLKKEFLCITKKIINMDIFELNKILQKYNENKELLEDVSSISDLIDIDCDKLIDLVSKIKNEANGYVSFDIKTFKNNDLEGVYKILEDKKLLFLYQTWRFSGIVTDKDKLNEILSKNIFNDIDSHNYDNSDKQGLGTIIIKTITNPQLEKALLDILDNRIVIDNPRILNIFDNNEELLENIYQINIYNSWYEKIINNNIVCGGINLTFDNNQINKISNILIEAIETPIIPIPGEENSSLSERINNVFFNIQLINNLTKEMLTTYSIEKINKITSESKFKYKDFPNYNYFGNFFKSILGNYLDEDKALELFNKLYQYKNNPKIKEFIIKICNSSKMDMLETIVYNDNDGSKDFNNSLFDYLINKVDTMTEEELCNYIDSVSIKTEELIEILVTNFDESTESIGNRTFNAMKNNFITNFSQIKNNLANKIANSYILRKLKENKKTKNNKREEINEYGKIR